MLGRFPRLSPAMSPDPQTMVPAHAFGNNFAYHALIMTA